MATATPKALGRFVQHLAAACTADVPDAQLLARFAAGRDEAAFAALVRRHGPMVLASCRRVLRDWHAAQDCFQLTFLLLARKAGTLERPESLGPWLHGVATRTALRARSQAARRRQAEAQIQPATATETENDLVWRDLRPVLDEAVGRLPEPFRVPFVLHHLQGLTVTEVARRLGWPRGTVAARLARARQRLRQRLSGRGLTLSAAVLGAVLVGSEAPACVPVSLVRTVVQAAVAAGAERALPLALEQGGGKTMLMAKGKIVAALLLAVAAGGGAALSQLREVASPKEGCAVEARASREQSSAPTAPPMSRIVATVNGVPVLAEEVYAAAFLALPDAFDPAAPECVRRLHRAWRETLDRVVEREVVVQSACAVLKARAPRMLGKVQEAASGEFNRAWLRAARKQAGRKGEELEAFLRARGTLLAAVRRQWQRDFVARDYLRSRLAAALAAGTAPRGEAAQREKERIVARLKRQAVIEYPGGR